MSPALQTDSRTLIVEAVVANDDGSLEARLVRHGADRTGRPERPACSRPQRQCEPSSGTSRVFVVADEPRRERLVTTGQTVGDLVEITSGLKAGEQVVTTNVNQIVDGVRVVAATSFRL